MKDFCPTVNEKGFAHKMKSHINSLEGLRTSNLTTNKNKKANSKEPLHKKCEDLNNSTNSKIDMSWKPFRNGRGFLGMKIQTQRNIKDGLGLGFVIIGIYFIFIVVGLFSLNSRFQFLNNKLILFIISMILILLGGLMNDQFRRIFKN